MKSVVLQVKGMHCGGCAQSVKRLLEREPGVQSADVAYETGEARVVFDPARLDEQRLIAVVEGPGYEAVLRPPM